MEIEIKKSGMNGRYLYINGIRLGEYIYGEDKKYLNPEKWAKEQLRKRNKVIDRNIERLEYELDKWKEEKRIINI